MKFSKQLITTLLLTTLVFSQYSNFIFAVDLLSPNYKMLEPNVNSGSAIGQSATYSSKIVLGDIASNPQLTSSTYKMNGNQINGFTAEIPTVGCFEGSTSGSSTCSSGPSYISSGGMVRVCGNPGCYDRARFEIDGQGNPSDTLYSVQISEDINFTTFQYISGTTNLPIAATSRTMADFLTETVWETPIFNVLGLKPNTQYYLRFTALHGDLTESAPGPASTITTSTTAIALNLNFADETESNPISGSNINFALPSGITSKAPQLIWTDMSSNLFPGVSVYVKGAHGGLYDGLITAIPSSSTDLGTASEGFGLQAYTSSQWYDTGNTGGHGEGNLGSIIIENAYQKTYGGATENVGIIPQTPTLQKVFSTTTPVVNGKTGLYIVAKSNATKMYQTSMSEDITIVVTANY
jgi:hypothetical protein